MKPVLSNDSTVRIKILQWVNGIKYNTMVFVRTDNGPHPPPHWSFLLSWWPCFLPDSWPTLGLPIIQPHELVIFWVPPGPTFHHLQTCGTLFRLKVYSPEIARGVPRGRHSKPRTSVTERRRRTHLLSSVCMIIRAPSSSGKSTTESSWADLSLRLQLLIHGPRLGQLFVKWGAFLPSCSPLNGLGLKKKTTFLTSRGVLGLQETSHGVHSLQEKRP